MVGPLLLNADGSEQAGGRRKLPTPPFVLWHAIEAARLQWLFRFRLADFLLHRDPLPDGPVEVEAISGACIWRNRSAHSQSPQPDFCSAVQIGLIGAMVLWSMWLAHLRLFRGEGAIA